MYNTDKPKLYTTKQIIICMLMSIQKIIFYYLEKYDSINWWTVAPHFK